MLTPMKGKYIDVTDSVFIKCGDKLRQNTAGCCG